MHFDALGRVALYPFAFDLHLTELRATYTGTVIPLEGPATIDCSSEGIIIEIRDDQQWMFRMMQRRGGAVPFGGLFRDVRPGRLIDDDAYGTIESTDGQWVAPQAPFIGERHAEGPFAFRFRVRELTFFGQNRNANCAVSRTVYAGQTRYGTGFLLNGRRVILRQLTEWTDRGRTVPVGAAVFDWEPSDLESEAVWNTLSFADTFIYRPLATEYFDAEANLIRTVRRLGADSHYLRQTVFEYNGASLLGSDSIGAIVANVLRLLEVRFPIEMVIHHFSSIVELSFDVQAQHLILSIHAAFEAWNRFAGSEYWMSGPRWRPIARRIRGLIPDEIYAQVGEEIRRNIRDDLGHSNRTSMAWRQQQMFDALGLDVSDEGSRRALAMRNELLHNGFFLTRFTELSPAGQQDRFEDITRLRRIAIMVIIRLVGYTGRS